jgi:hypothetical protein
MHKMSEQNVDTVKIPGRLKLRLLLYLRLLFFALKCRLCGKKLIYNFFSANTLCYLKFYFDQQIKKTGLIFPPFQIICIFNSISINKMKKGILHTAMSFSFFFRIPCKNLYEQSALCKQNATWSAGPLFQFFRAFFLMNKATLISRVTTRNICCIVPRCVNRRQFILCNSFIKLDS